MVRRKTNFNFESTIPGEKKRSTSILPGEWFYRNQRAKSFSNQSMIEVKGKLVDDQTRCEHYHSPPDIIAIKFKCCNEYYPCYQCHEETTNHKAQAWRKDERNTKAILCGACKTELTINEYFNSNNHCPNCNADFNPGCSKHYHLYFEK